MHIKHTNYMGRRETYTVEEFIHLRLTEHNDGGELEQMRRQIDRNTEMLAKVAALLVRSEDDLRGLVYFDGYSDEVIV